MFSVKIATPVKPPPFENLVGGSPPPPAEREGGAHYDDVWYIEREQCVRVLIKGKKC